MSALLQLIIFAVLAGVVLYQLYAVLGRRVGRQPEDAAADTQARRVGAPEPARPEPAEVTAPTGVAAIRHRDPAFDPEAFLYGAKGAYARVVRAFAAGDREQLRRLLAPAPLAAFEAAITEREAQGLREEAELLHEPRADIEDAEATGDAARVKVRFLAEVRTRSHGPEGEAVDDRRTAELWTFERPFSSRDPNWTLVRVDPAEA